VSEVSEPRTLLLRETGIARLPNGRQAVNVGPIVAALAFLTEGRGEDRGTDEDGAPLPDLLSLAFDVVRSIIVGGRHADYFRQVKRDFDAQADGGTQTSLALAKQASALRRSEPELESESESEPEPEPESEVELSGGTTDLHERLASLQEAAAQLVRELAALQPAPAKRRKRTKPKKPVKAKPAVRAKPAPTKKKKKKTGRR
jgi:hypothetical protein